MCLFKKGSTLSALLNDLLLIQYLAWERTHKLGGLQHPLELADDDVWVPLKLASGWKGPATPTKVWWSEASITMQANSYFRISSILKNI